MRNTASGFATMIAPRGSAPGSSRSGSETARKFRPSPGGENSNRSWPSRSAPGRDRRLRDPGQPRPLTGESRSPDVEQPAPVANSSAYGAKSGARRPPRRRAARRREQSCVIPVACDAAPGTSGPARDPGTAAARSPPRRDRRGRSRAGRSREGGNGVSVARVKRTSYRLRARHASTPLERLCGRWRPCSRRPTP